MEGERKLRKAFTAVVGGGPKARISGPPPTLRKGDGNNVSPAQKSREGEVQCECPCRTSFQSPVRMIDVLFVKTLCRLLVSDSEGVTDRLGHTE